MGTSSSSLEERARSFDEVRRLVGNGMTNQAEVVRTLREDGLAVPSRKTITRWMQGKTSPLASVRPFDPTPSDELSFFVGAWLGDGWGDTNDGGKRMLLKVRSYDFAKEFAVCAAKILGKSDSYWVRRVHDDNGDWYLVKVTSMLLFDFVNQPLAKLLTFVGEKPKGFLRGFFTAEGNPSISIENAPVPYLGIGLSVTNNELRLLNYARYLLTNLGMHPGRPRLNTAKGEVTNFGVAGVAVWTVSLSTIGDVRRFSLDIGFADSKKQSKLLEALSLVDTLGRVGAAMEWPMRYEKLGGKWTRRSVAATS